VRKSDALKAFGASDLCAKERQSFCVGFPKGKFGNVIAIVGGIQEGTFFPTMLEIVLQAVLGPSLPVCTCLPPQDTSRDAPGV
jgi:hypothetical protein